MYTKKTYGALVSQSYLEGITLPYNIPDVSALNFLLLIDMTSTYRGLVPNRTNSVSTKGVTPKPKIIDKDVFDSNYWDTNQITALVMPWIPFFSNCDGFDSHIIMYEAFEYHPNCTLPATSNIEIVNPIPSRGLDPTADNCHIEI